MFNLKTMSMNIKHWMLALALMGVGTACSDEMAEKTDIPSGESGEIQLYFSGSSDDVSYTKAIATEKESEISTLKIYVFASDAKDGTYSYLETWTKVDATPDKNANTFTLDAAGSSWKGSIYPHEKKGLPYLKLYCISNMTNLLQKNGDPFSLVSVATDETGAITTIGTKDTEFEKIYSDKVVSESIKTPLVMSGVGTTKISGSVSKLTVDLYRIVSRFDIDNTTTRSQLTIERITFANARSRSALYTGDPIEYIEKPSEDKTGWILTYPEVNFTELENANKGETPSAFYVHPNLASDSTYMIIKGTYKSPTTGKQIPVVYTLPVAQTDPETGNSAYIEIKRNNRYKLRIMDVTSANIFGTFEVVDWTSGGGIYDKPDNTAPEFLADQVKGIESATPTVDKATNTIKLSEDAGTFEIAALASSEVRAEMELMTKAAGDWLTLLESSSTSADGKTTTKMKFSYTGATGQMPYKVTLINDAASYDPDLQTVLTISGPLAAPKLSDPKGHTTGNSLDLSEIANMKASMYKVAGSAVKVSVLCIDGITVDAMPEGFAISDPEVDGFTSTYTISITDTTKIKADPKITFRNKEDKTTRIKAELNIELQAPQMTLEAGEDTYNCVTIDNAANKINVDIDLLGANNSFTFKVKAPQGLTAPINLGQGSAWVEVVEKTAWSSSTMEAEYTVTQRGGTPANYDNFAMTFVNTLKNAPNLTVTLVKLPSKPKLAAVGGADLGLNTLTIVDDTTATATMYRSLSNSMLVIKATCPEGITLGGTENMSISRPDGNYQLRLGDVSKFRNPTHVVEFQNNEQADRKAKLTITFIDPQATVAAGVSTYLSVNGDTRVVTVDATTALADGGGSSDMQAGTLVITAPKGSTVTPTSNAWLKAAIGGRENQAVTIDDTGRVTCILTALVAGASESASTTIVVHNSILNTEETITISKK